MHGYKETTTRGATIGSPPLQHSMWIKPRDNAASKQAEMDNPQTARQSI